jgi:hypothetical protein
MCKERLIFSRDNKDERYSYKKRDLTLFKPGLQATIHRRRVKLRINRRNSSYSLFASLIFVICKGTPKNLLFDKIKINTVDTFCQYF